MRKRSLLRGGLALPWIATFFGVGVAAISVAACAPAVGVAGRPTAPAPSTAAAVPTVAIVPTKQPQADAGATATPAPSRPAPEASSAAANVPVGVNVGQRAPDFDLPTLDGKRVKLSDFRGKTVLVNFWASWCPPCREEMPALNDLYQKYRDKGFVVLAVNMAEDPNTAAAFVKKGGYSFPVALDQNGDSARTYQAFSLPVSYFVGPDGIIRDRIIGAMTRQVMETKAQRFLASAGLPQAQPSSVVRAAGTANDQVVATIGNEKITMREVNQRVDVQLAIERLETGAVLDPSRPADQAELKQRQSYALDQLVNERLLANAARNAGIKPAQTDVDDTMKELATRAGGADKLPGELAKHGVTVDDLKAFLTDGALANAYVLQVVVKQPGVKSLDDAIQKWIEAERARRGVKILAKLDSGTR